MRTSSGRLQLAAGVALFASASGLVARTRNRWLRIDLHDRALERSVVEQLAAGGLRAESLPAAALRPILEHGLVAARGAAAAEHPVGLPPDVWVGAPDDAALGERVLAAVGRGEAFTVAWIDERGGALARHDPSVRGCPACAWRTDSSLARYVALGVDLAGVPRAFADRSGLLAWVCERVAGSAETLSGGRVVVRDALGGSERTEEIVAHPSCVCASRSEGAAPDADWESLASRRYAPVWPVARSSGSRAARVLFRRSRAPWKSGASALGVALAAGPEAETRALAEAVERYCFLHAPPHHTEVTARSLGEQAMDAESVRSLLFRAREYTAPGFRFLRYDVDARQSFCVARSISGDREILVPASLVGRVPQGSTPLVDATSNGYAAHRDRARAIERALLELIERDAVLVHWYAPLHPLPAIDVDLGLPRSRALLATQDVDLPIVLALGLQDDGSLRCGAAADVTIDAALGRARAELSVALGGNVLGGPSAPLEAADRKFDPDDHLRRYAGERGRAIFEALTASAPTVRMDVLRERWPNADSSLAVVDDALSRLGLEAWVVDRSLPDVFGHGWHVVRAIVPDLVELSWGLAYRRLASPRIAERLARGAVLSDTPHPLA